MRSSLKYSGALALVAVFALSACGNSDSTSDATGARTKNAVLGQATTVPESEIVEAVATKQVVTTTVAPATTTTVAESQASSNAMAVTTTVASAMSSSTATTVANAVAADETTTDTMTTTDEEVATEASDTTVVPTDDTDATEAKTASASEDKKDSSNSWLVPTLVIVILGAGGVFAYSRKKK